MPPRPVRLVLVQPTRTMLAVALGRHPDADLAAILHSLADLDTWCRERGERIGPELALVDADLPDGQGHQVAALLDRHRLTTRTAVLATRASGLQQALDSGCAGYLRAVTPLAELLDALHDVVDGRTVVDPIFRRVSLQRNTNDATEATAAAIFLDAESVPDHVRRLTARLGPSLLSRVPAHRDPEEDEGPYDAA